VLHNDTNTTLNLKQLQAPGSIHAEHNDNNTGEKEKSKKVLDPTQWFAYLPSPALKQSQTNFKSGTNIIEYY